MPTVLRAKGFDFSFYSADLDEPPHVHIKKDGNEAKYWLAPIALASNRGFRDYELNRIEKLLLQYRGRIMRRWQEEDRKRDN